VTALGETGIMTTSAGSLIGPVRLAADRQLPRFDLACEVRVVVRNKTGVSNCSLKSSARADHLFGFLAVTGFKHGTLQICIVAVVRSFCDE